jgi:hypothetical protein
LILPLFTRKRAAREYNNISGRAQIKTFPLAISPKKFYIRHIQPAD